MQVGTLALHRPSMQVIDEAPTSVNPTLHVNVIIVLSKLILLPFAGGPGSLQEAENTFETY